MNGLLFNSITNNIAIGGKLTSWINSHLKEVTSTIGSEVLESIGSFFSELIDGVCNSLNNAVQALLQKPNFSSWDKYVGAGTADAIIDASRIFGAAILIFLVIVYVIKLVTGPKNIDLTPTQFFFRLILSASLIVSAKGTITLIMDTLSSITSAAYAESANNIDFTKLLSMQTAGKVAIVGVEVAASLLVPPMIGILIIIALLVSWPIIKNFFRFLIEAVERYLVFIICLLFLPAAAGTLCSKESENVFKSWFRTVLSQGFLLMIYFIFGKAIVYVIMDNTLNMKGIAGYVFCLGMLRTAQRLDAVLQSMGLNIAQCVGGVWDSMASAGRALGNELLGGKGSLRSGAGEMAKAIGAATGNKGLFEAGSVMGAGVASLAKGEGLSPASVASSYAKQRASMGLPTDLSGSDARSVVARALQNPAEARQWAQSLSGTTLNEGLGAMVAGQNLSNVSDARLTNDGASFRAIGADGEEHSFSISNKDDGLGVAMDGDCKGMYLNSVASMSDGDVVSGSTQEISQAVGAMGLENDSLMDNVDSATAENGGYTLKNGSENVGRIDKDGSVFQANDVSQNLDQLNKDFAKAMPNYSMITNEKTGETGFKQHTDGSVYALVQKDGSDTIHKVYASDYVSKNTKVPTEPSAKKSVTHSSSSGHKTRTIFSVSGEKEKVEMK